MKLVTVAKITLNRPGALGSGDFQRAVRNNLSDPTRTVHVILDGDEPEDVLKKVQEVAMAHGASQNVVEGLTACTPFGAARGTMSFNERFSPTGVQFSGYYADTEVFPALEIEGRFFQLNEVDVSR